MDLGCDHGLGFDKSLIKDVFPDILQVSWSETAATQCTQRTQCTSYTNDLLLVASLLTARPSPQEVTVVISSIYLAATKGEKMDGEVSDEPTAIILIITLITYPSLPSFAQIPLPNLYYSPSTPPPTPTTSSKYAIVAALGMFLSRPDGYSFLCERSRSLEKEFLTSAVGAGIYCRDGEEVRGGRSEGRKAEAKRQQHTAKHYN